MTGSTSPLITVLSLYCLILPLVSLLASQGVVPVLVVTALVAGVLAWRSGSRLRLPDLKVVAVLGLLLVWCFVASFWSVDFERALLLTGRITALFAAGTLLFAVATELDDTARLRLGRSLALGMALSLALMAGEIVFGYPLFQTLRPEAMEQADIRVALNRGATAMAILVWPTMASLWACGRGRTAFALLVATGLVLPFLTSMAAIIGFAGGAVVAAVAYAHARAGRVVLIIATVAALVVGPFTAKWLHALEWQDAPWLSASAQHRVEIWNFTAELIAEKPIFGWGFDASRHISDVRPQIEESGRAAMSLHPHNAPLQILLELGIVGGLIALGLTLILIERISALPRPAGACAQAMYASTLLIACTAYGLWQNQWLALMISAGLAVALTTESSATPRSRDVPAVSPARG